MKTRCIIIIMNILLILSLTSCKNDNSYSENVTYSEEITEMETEGMNLISEEEFYKKTGISKNDYPDVDINQFIAHYSITEDNIGDLRIEKLLEKYRNKVDVKSFDYLFDSNYQKRNDNYTNDIVRIAAVYNISTTIKSVLYDIETQKKYYSNNGYIFHDVNQVEAVSLDEKEYSDLISLLESVNAFDWKNNSVNSNSTAGQLFELVVEYSDGTYYKVKFSGILSKAAPSEYETLVDKLFK